MFSSQQKNLVAPNDKERMSQLKIYAAFQPIRGYNDNYCPIEKMVIGDRVYEATYLRNQDETATDVMELLEMYTINGAKQMRMEDKIGSLEVGQKADIVILEKDITKIEPKHITETKIVNTIFDGRIVYEAVN